MEILPPAPPPPPRQLSEQERLRLEEQEEDVLRELRLFLRNVTERLTLDRRFKAFSKPVDIEEVSGFSFCVTVQSTFAPSFKNVLLISI